MKKNIILLFALGAMIIGFAACEKTAKDLTPPVIDEAGFLPADCDIYYLGDTIQVHFVCSDDTELGNFNIEIHNNFDHHTHGTSSVDCDGEEGDDHHHDGDEEHEHEHEAVEGAWVFNQDYAIVRGLSSDTVDIAIPVPADVLEGDYHFMLRLTDRAGWQTLKAVAIHLHNPNE
ncbi:MAG: DUF4625 domain-containing protein [Paludibacteraceae bacterium]|nr:DUF4625 domain-containing protein [Paludibacteraceae bacterium]